MRVSSPGLPEAPDVDTQMQDPTLLACPFDDEDAPPCIVRLSFVQIAEHLLLAHKYPRPRAIIYARRAYQAMLVERSLAEPRRVMRVAAPPPPWVPPLTPAPIRQARKRAVIMPKPKMTTREQKPRVTTRRTQVSRLVSVIRQRQAQIAKLQQELDEVRRALAEDGPTPKSQREQR